MPRLDGLQLVAALRADPRTAGHAGAAAVRPGRAGGLHRGPGGRRRRLPGQAVRRRRTAGPGPGERRAGPAAQPPRPLAHRAGRLAAGGVLRLRRGRRRHRDQRRVHRHPRLRPRGPALPADPPVVAGRRTPTRRLTGRSPRPSTLLRRADQRHATPSRSPTATGTGCGSAAAFNQVAGPRHRPPGDRRHLPRRHRRALRRPAGERPGRAQHAAVPGRRASPTRCTAALDELQELWQAGRVVRGGLRRLRTPRR